MTPTAPPRSPALQRSHPWKLRLLNLYPPYLGAGVRVRQIGSDPLAFEVTTKLRFWNRNYFGTQFGGTLYSMCDPFFCLILIEALGGRDFVVWDKAATIRFLRPGKTAVSVRFEIPRERIEEIRAEALRLGKLEPTFIAQVRDTRGELVAEIEKLLYVRKKTG